MGDHVALSLRVERPLADREPLAELDQPGFADEVGRRGLAQEVDRHVGGDRMGDPAELAQDRDIERDVAEREHCWPGNGPAVPQVSRMMDEAQRCGHRREVFDPKVAPFPELREDLDEIGAQFVDGEGARLGVAHDHPKYQIHPGASTGAPGRTGENPPPPRGFPCGPESGKLFQPKAEPGWSRPWAGDGSISERARAFGDNYLE